MVFNLFGKEPQNNITNSTAGVEHFVIRDLTEAKNRSFEVMKEMAPYASRLIQKDTLMPHEQEVYNKLEAELADLKVFIESEEPAGTE